MDSSNTFRNWQFVLVGFVFLLYANTLFNGYNLDDELVTTDQNELVQQGVSALPEIFTTHYLAWNDYKADYRPLVKASFAIEYQFFGFNPFISHLINILLFALIIQVLFRFLRKVFPDSNIHLLGVAILLFAAHPINTEVVASLKNRDELLSFLFVLLAFQMAFRWLAEHRFLQLVFMIGFFFLSLLSKMSSVTWLPVFAAVLIFNKISRKKATTIIGSLGVLIALFYAAVFGLLEGWGREFVFIEVPYFEIESVSAKWASIISAAGYYLKLLIYPYPLCCYYGFNQVPVTDWSDWTVYASVLSYVLLIALAFRGLWKKDMIGLGAIIILCDLALFVNVLYPYTGVIGERVLFGSTLGIALILVGLASKMMNVQVKTLFQLIKSSATVSVILLIFIGVGGWLTVNRNADWKNRMTLFSVDAKNCKNSVKLQQLYAHHLRQEYLDNPSVFTEERASEVLKAYQKAIDLYDGWPITHYGAGNVLFFDLSDSQSALPYYQKAVELNPDFADAQYDLLNTYLELGEFKNAEETMLLLAERFPDDITLYDRVLKALFAIGSYEHAENINQKFLSAHPKSNLPLIYQGNFRVAEGDTLAALPFFEKALKVNPDYSELEQYLNHLYDQLGKEHNKEN